MQKVILKDTIDKSKLICESVSVDHRKARKENRNKKQNKQKMKLIGKPKSQHISNYFRGSKTHRTEQRNLKIRSHTWRL